MVRYEIDFVHPALDLVNSRHGRNPDLLDDAEWFDGFLARWGYAAAGPPTARDRTRLADLRTLMRRIVETIDQDERPAAVDLAELHRVLRAAAVRRELVREGSGVDLRLVPVRPDWRWVVSELAASLVELLARAEPDRLKVCDNRECRFAFYDASKNRSRRWCAQTTCGNRHKVRLFRERRRARLATDP